MFCIRCPEKEVVFLHDAESARTADDAKESKLGGTRSESGLIAGFSGLSFRHFPGYLSFSGREPRKSSRRESEGFREGSARTTQPSLEKMYITRSTGGGIGNRVSGAKLSSEPGRTAFPAPEMQIGLRPSENSIGVDGSRMSSGLGRRLSQSPVMGYLIPGPGRVAPVVPGEKG